jgi:hypothetical protein
VKKLLLLSVLVVGLVLALESTADVPKPMDHREIAVEEVIVKPDYVTYQQVQPVFINNCAGCHNASTPDMNWLDQKVATFNKKIIYHRVFVHGDMPLWLKYFSWNDRRLLEKWLTQESIVEPEVFRRLESNPKPEK